MVGMASVSSYFLLLKCVWHSKTRNTDNDLVDRLNQLDDDDNEFELEEIAAKFSDEETPDPNDVDEW